MLAPRSTFSANHAPGASSGAAPRRLKRGQNPTKNYIHPHVRRAHSLVTNRWQVPELQHFRKCLSRARPSRASRARVERVAGYSVDEYNVTWPLTGRYTSAARLVGLSNGKVAAFFAANSALVTPVPEWRARSPRGEIKAGKSGHRPGTVALSGRDGTH